MQVGPMRKDVDRTTKQDALFQFDSAINSALAARPPTALKPFNQVFLDLLCCMYGVGPVFLSSRSYHRDVSSRFAPVDFAKVSECSVSQI
jgi:hypothetical protein